MMDGNHDRVLGHHGGDEFVRLLDPTDVDVLVVAGDLCTSELLPDALGRLCARYPEVVYVVGNHEYYRSSPVEVHDELARVCERLPNLRWLHHETVELHGLRFAGTPLWFRPGAVAEDHRHLLSDFAVIEDFEPWVYEENERALEFLWREAPRADIVVTHHLPSQRSVAPQFLGSPLNCYFVCECESVLTDSRPALWVHGHSHAACDYELRGTRVVCNPLGYPGEGAHRFDDRKIITVAAHDPCL